MTIYFDLDGTLLDVAARYHAVYGSIVRSFGHRPLGRGRYWAMKRVGWKDSAICRRHHAGLPVDLYRRLFLERIESPGALVLDTLAPGAPATIAVLAGRHRLAVATLRRHAGPMREQMRRLGLTSCFAATLQREGNDGGWRNKSEMILEDESRGDGGALVGDSEGDIQAARRAGVLMIAVSGGMRSRRFLQSRSPDHLIGTLLDLSGCLPPGQGSPVSAARRLSAGREGL